MMGLWRLLRPGMLWEIPLSICRFVMGKVISMLATPVEVDIENLSLQLGKIL